jgi:UDP-GlcNAc:undecaprenyl-phosphate GlcNAc-1-phosphate transferase
MVFLSTLLISMFITMALIPILRMAAVRLHAGLDVPDARKVHDHPVPKVGGLAMAVGALVPVILVADGGRFVNSVLIGACVIVLFGLVDDLKNLGWKAKFAGQVLAALIVILYGKLNICFLGSCLPEGVSLPELLALPVTLVVIVGVTNAINLSDGLDGLAGGTSLLVFICIGLLCYTGGDFAEKLAIMLLCTAVAGSILGFLRFNTYPANVFMGDTGSQLLGFLAVTLALGITQRETPLSPLLTLLLLGFPVLDTLTVMAERIAAGRMPFAPDKNHFHHKLMRLGLFHTEAVAAIYAITAFLTAMAYLLRFHSDWLLLGCYASFCALVVSAFTIAERRGFRFHRTGFFDVGIKGRLKIFKDKNLLIRVCFLPLQYGLPLLFMAAVLVRGEVPGYLAAVAAALAATILIVRLMRKDWVNTVIRVAFYLMVPMVLSLGDAEPAGGVKPALLAAYHYAFGALALFTVMTLKFTRRRRGFRATPMDFLILLIALVVPNLPDAFISGLRLGDVAVKTIVLYFGFEVLVGELRGELRKIALGVLAGLTLIALRALITF